MRFARAERRRNEREAARSQKDQPPAYIDLVHWIKMREHLSTRKAMAIIMAGALKVDSHTIGTITIKMLDKERTVISRYVPASYRGRIEVVTPEGL